MRTKTHVRQKTAKPRSTKHEWTANGFLTAKDGTSFCVQREQTYGAQSGGLIYYAWRRRPGETEWSAVTDTTRTREPAVRKLIERMVEAINGPPDMTQGERLSTGVPNADDSLQKPSLSLLSDSVGKEKEDL